MGQLTHDEFFTKLADIFTTRKTKAHGAVFLTQKRLTFSQPATTSSEASPLPLLIRATNGKGKADRASKIKLSTVVQPAELEGFYARYAEACKAGMAALKPRDRTKRKAKAKKKRTPAGAAA
ncbi:signal recognition particle 14kD protein-domain-containing protein [Staphylotrichum tortipilum]|uniref:Signal recognition particle subunit SRP14 n=1 Tax=Staphylotrichum tortipilum TaxID=2831512 RepID=A0AAN6RX84_9PEZI|nr:signal recognition particle 14kD protein-domain-containing protein [Staphylotrichum longicolle]